MSSNVSDAIAKSFTEILLDKRKCGCIFLNWSGKKSIILKRPDLVETSVTVNKNSPIQEYVHPDDQSQPTFEILFKGTSSFLCSPGAYFKK